LESSLIFFIFSAVAFEVSVFSFGALVPVFSVSGMNDKFPVTTVGVHFFLFSSSFPNASS